MAKPGDFPEAYEITKILEVVTNRDFEGSGTQSTIRIEVLRRFHSGKFTVRWRHDTSFHMQPSFPVKNGKFAKSEDDYAVWVPFQDMPWVDEVDEDTAVKRALGWLKERDDQGSGPSA